MTETPDFNAYLSEQGLTGVTADEPTAAEPESVDAEAVEPVADQPVEAEAEVAAPARDERGRFVSPEEKLEEKDRMINRLGNELGDLRKVVEQLAEPAVAPEPEVQHYDLSGADEAVTERGDPAFAQQVAAQALRQNDMIAYERALRAWGDFDGFGALRFEQQRQLYQFQSQMMEQVTPAVQSVQQMTQEQATANAIVAASRELPDLQQVLVNLAESGTEIPPAIKRAVEDPSDVEGLKVLYHWAISQGAASDAAVATATAAETEQREAAKAGAAAVAVPSAPATEDTKDSRWGPNVPPDIARLYDSLTTPPPTSLLPA